jgi:hypothetical protein
VWVMFPSSTQASLARVCHMLRASCCKDRRGRRFSAGCGQNVPVYGADCYRFVPLTVETCGRLGRPFMDLLTDVSFRASQHSLSSVDRRNVGAAQFQGVSSIMRLQMRTFTCRFKRNSLHE